MTEYRKGRKQVSDDMRGDFSIKDRNKPDTSINNGSLADRMSYGDMSDFL